jgi:hypothetical protein
MRENHSKGELGKAMKKHKPEQIVPLLQHICSQTMLFQPECQLSILFDILPSLKGEDSFGLLPLVLRDGFGEFLPQRPDIRRGQREASLLGCPPVGLLDELILG